MLENVYKTLTYYRLPFLFRFLLFFRFKYCLCSSDIFEYRISFGLGSSYFLAASSNSFKDIFPLLFVYSNVYSYVYSVEVYSDVYSDVVISIDVRVKSSKIISHKRAVKVDRMITNKKSITINAVIDKRINPIIFKACFNVPYLQKCVLYIYIAHIVL